MKLQLQLLAVALFGARQAFAAFGFTTSGRTVTVDTESSEPFTFAVNTANCDITSLLYRGTQYQYRGQSSHIGSGLGSATVTPTLVGSEYVKITCVTPTLTHYYVAKKGHSTVYMATHITQSPEVGELRYIGRLERSVLPKGMPGSYTDLGAETVEGKDVFRASNGQTFSKFYSSVRFIDDQVHSVGSDDVLISMVIPDPTSYETSSGGPFFRDINSDRGSSYHSLYWYMNSGHAKTEPDRMGLNGPYAMVFSRSQPPPKNLDVSFFGQLDIKGYVGPSGRGTVSGTASGVPENYQRVVHWSNTAAQYWTYVSANGSFTSPPMKAGTYTMKLYRDEFEVASQSVSVTAGGATSSNIASTEPRYNAIWTIGEFNGQPKGFQNADLIETMHPSDPRMSAWTPKTFVVGTTALSGFPMAQIKALNNPTTITFNLQSGQTGAATLRIGTTLSFAGGRPQVQVNNWSGPNPQTPPNLNSRGFTRGTYRGHNIVYTFNIPAGTLVAGTNTIRINTLSGSSGEGHLSPNFIYDAVQLVSGN